MYFDMNESKSHLEAKEKLFDLITSKRIKVIDQYDNEYKIFTGQFDDEFLHMESFVMDNSSDVLFSNNQPPCKKYIKEYKKSPFCNLEGYYGAFKKLPCEKCISHNFRKQTIGSSKFANYRPDIAFGYGGKHKIWFEIKHTNPCSKNKIEFCKKNGIVLLEIEDKDISSFKEFNGVLKFTKLEEYIHEVNFYEELNEIIKYAEEKIKENKFVLPKELIDSFIDNMKPNLITPQQWLKYKKTMEGKFIQLEVSSKEVKKYFGLKRKSVIWTDKEIYQELISNKIIDPIEVVVKKNKKRN